MSIIDFRLRPPAGQFLSTLMYAQGERRDGFTRTVGFEPSPAAQQQSMQMTLEEMDEAGVAHGVVVGRLAGMLGSISNDDVLALMQAHGNRFIGAASIDPTNRIEACRSIDQSMAAGFRLINIEPGAIRYPCTRMIDACTLFMPIAKIARFPLS